MKYSALLFSLVAVVPAAHGIAFGESTPTAKSPQRALDEMSPKPTKGPSVVELRKRQSDVGPETCGWVDGDNASGVTCNVGRTCMFYTSASVGMAGCCDGSETQDCDWKNSCIDYVDYLAGDCGDDCLTNSFVRKCTRIASPYCVTWTYPSNGVLDYGCQDISSGLVYTMLQSASNSSGDSTTSVNLPTLSGNAVTGFDQTTTSAAVTGFAETTATTATTATDGTTYSPITPVDSGSSVRTKAKKTIAIGLIVGVATTAVVIIFVVIVGIVFCMKKKKKQRLIAANAQLVAANPPQSQFPPPQQQMAHPQMPIHTQTQMQQPSFNASLSPQSPQSAVSGYFPPSEQKFIAQPQVYEYAHTPISNPPTPAPAYVQPQYGVPPMPNPVVPHAAGGYQRPVEGAHEVDAISVPHAPVGGGPVYELGQGR
ncbi:hypothetical protein P153DRAFT_380628 [Dothidotthia symphoricarpi CBS 119687]|uniref:Mid2 domain-containing protein n=1 Tax=Dothidotthia symphoricarpi CBS 119687 TaxID=1392245 RepID=A0A6A6AV42_9PLEO|nr:uncharacterized protein P153DRAFT_380628 [Dothidotthia symphoricarpi CBS 119687]KAF2134814.1 hypothetical protein P153DRAFT_380628 [Dothidotthia symphoricarpi CBS 119687]